MGYDNGLKTNSTMFKLSRQEIPLVIGVGLIWAQFKAERVPYVVSEKRSLIASGFIEESKTSGLFPKRVG